ncbi:cobalamin adenosyltransferase [Bacteroidia bacterium]|nr:cobalamin adenosyltransferase [Bacteroidia bacterium]
MTKSKIYTKKGDEGLTSLVGGKRVPKTNRRIEAYGTIDELNAFIACLLEEIDNREDRELLLRIQSDLFVIGAYLASEAGLATSTVSDEAIERLELEIDKIDALIPPLKFFVLPGGCKGNAVAHVCRTVCRRAERAIFQLHKKEKVNEKILKYINRLSDYFFLFSRKQNFIHNNNEIIWENACK